LPDQTTALPSLNTSLFNVQVPMILSAVSEGLEETCAEFLRFGFPHEKRIIVDKTKSSFCFMVKECGIKIPIYLNVSLKILHETAL
jgi:hypothetical protein